MMAPLRLRNPAIMFAQFDCFKKVCMAAKIGFNGSDKKLALIVGLLKGFQI